MSRSPAMSMVGHTDLGLPSDALQVMVGPTHAFVSHPFSGGFSVVDVRNPAQPTVACRVPGPIGTKTLHLQLVGDILICSNEAGPAAVASLAGNGSPVPEYSAGIRVYDVSDPSQPRQIGFTHTPGFGVHRLYWTGGVIAAASVQRSTDPDFVLATVDMSNPASPEIQDYWAPDLVETIDRSERVVGLHHAIVGPDARLYGAWRDAGVRVLAVEGDGLTVVTTADAGRWSGSRTHTVLPLVARGLMVVLDEAMTESCTDGRGGIYLLESGSESEPPRVAGVLPEPDDDDYCRQPGRFGPHNLHENRPGSFVSEDIIFCAYQNAGLRAYDIGDVSRPREILSFQPPPAQNVIDPRPGATPTPRVDIADVFVASNLLAYATDLNGGLFVVDANGA